MPCTVILGAQFGDEGKGKVVDYYSKDADVIVRYQGGCNAGHTVVFGGQVFKLHLIPSGVFYGKRLIIGNGVVLDLETLSKEIDDLNPKIEKLDLLISNRTHVTLPFHKDLDGIEESFRGKSKIGTTKRGIGPTYTDKVARCGLRIVDLLDDEVLDKKLSESIMIKNRILKNVFESKTQISKKEILAYCMKHREKIKDYVGDASIELNNAIKQDKNVLFEGAQGTLLDIDHGTYPFVTSSNPTVGGVFTGTGIGPKHIDKIIGVMKGYITRVGGGPMTSEMGKVIGERTREKGKEFGATTGRPRRCGWLDAVILKYAIRLNSLNGIAITKLDVLGGLNKVKMCTSYKINGKTLEEFPASLKILEKCEPVYEEFDGWEDLSEEEWMEIVKKGYYALPKEMRNYLKKVEEIAGIPIFLISLGPDREATISIKEIFDH